MKNFEYVLPKSVEEASRASGEKGARLKAGGIDLLDEMKAYVATPERVVNLLQVPGLRGISEQPDGLHIGALTTLAEIAGAKVPAALREAAEEAATPQIRNMATAGGNLAQRPRCWYYRSDTFPCLKKGGTTCFAVKGENRYHAIFETSPCPIVHPSNLAPALVALEATVVTNRRKLSAGGFFVTPSQRMDLENVLEPGEIITEIVLPKKAWKSAYREGREKESFDWALVSAAVALEMEGETVRTSHVVLGSVAPIPWASKQAEALLKGKAVTSALAQAAAEVAFKGATPLSDNAYKVRLGKVILKRAILAAAGKSE